MRSRSWNGTGLPTTVMVLGLLTLAPLAQADPVVNYSTSGQVESTGVSGTGKPVIGFTPVISGTFNSPSSFSLGDFQVTGLNDGQSETYTNTPFHITLVVNSVDGKTPDASQAPIALSGVLNGTVTGGNQSDIKATFDPIVNPNFTAGSWANALNITDNPLTLVPSTTNNGQTSVQAFLQSTPTTNPPSDTGSGSNGGGGGGGGTGSPSEVPEPSTIALFLTTLAGLGLHRARRRPSA